MKAPAVPSLTAQIVAFPASHTPPAPPPDRPELGTALSFHSDRDIRMMEIAARLGIAHQTRQTIVQKLRNLANHHGLPLPRSIRFWKGQATTGPKSIHANSIWDRYPVDCWFDERTAPATRARLATVSHDRLRAGLAARAAEIAQIGARPGA